MAGGLSKVCGWNGCLRATRNRTGRCQQCEQDYPRASPSERGYDRHWKRLRRYVLEIEPWCRRCEQPAVVVDHIIPLSQGGERLSLTNVQPLCKPCHDRKTANEDRKIRRGQVVVQRAGCATKQV